MASNPIAFAVRYPDAPAPLGPYEGALANDGEPIEIRGADGTALGAFAYDDSWHPLSDGTGFSLNLADDATVPARYVGAGAWGASLVMHGTPGRPNGPALQLSFDTWLPRHFSPEEIALGQLTAPAADDDHDALALLVEFALGRDPHSPDTAAVRPAIRPDGSAVLTFDRPVGRAGLTTVLESSATLSAWLAHPNPEVTVTDNGDGTEHVEVVVPPAATGSFSRIRFSAE